MAIAFYKLLIFKTGHVLFLFFCEELGEWGLEVSVHHTVMPLYTLNKKMTM